MKKNIKNSPKIIKAELERTLGKDIKDAITPRQALEQWIKDLKPSPDVKGRVLITAFRNRTWIEWAIYCAAVIRQMGFESTILFKQDEIRKFYNEPSYFNFWEGVKKLPGIELVNIDDLPFKEEDYNKYINTYDKDLIAALAYDHHLESSDIIEQTEKFGTEITELKIEAAKNGARVYQYCKNNKFHLFICYSGIIRDTKLILQGALDAGQQTVCVEGWGWRPGHMIYNFNAPSLEYNVKGWMKYFGKWDEKKNALMSKYFSFLDGDKADTDWLKNFQTVQKAKKGEKIPEYIHGFLNGQQKIFLLACNVIGDSSLLNRETIFKSHRDFVKQNIEYFASRPDLKLIVRAHPGEGLVKAKVAIKMGEFAKQISKEISNVLVIDDTEKLNTFSLIPFVHAGLVWITSAGADMVVRGIPVISGAMPKYTGLGIVDEPKTQEEYFSLIDNYSKSEIKPTAEQILKAKEYLHLVFKGFSFEAQGRTFRANSCKLNKMPSQAEHDRFYKILLGLEPAPDQI